MFPACRRRETFKTSALEHIVLKRKTWLRFVDDTFIIWSPGKNSLSTFLSFLSNSYWLVGYWCLVTGIWLLVPGKLGHFVYMKLIHMDR